MNEMNELEQINVAWDRIEAWLGRHAPRTLYSLDDPVDEGILREAQRMLGLRFTPAIAASLRRHDGASAFLPMEPPTSDEAVFFLPTGCRPLSVVEMMIGTYKLRSLEAEDGEGAAMWEHGFAPIAMDTTTNHCHFIDCRSTYETHGRLGTFTPESGVEFTEPGSIGTLLLDAAEALEAGKGRLVDRHGREVDEDDPGAVSFRERALIWGEPRPPIPDVIEELDGPGRFGGTGGTGVPGEAA
ncbi:hypothetical protein [Streptomyces sp. NPDC092952]|uniref:hypothetical protein n=1 Tax=Streptomyces sp. NPDC092952 TaxID=3366018 RepID=UPI00382A4B46